MPAYSLNRFSNPETLRQIAPEHLLSLLVPHTAFFAERGVSLPEAAAQGAFDYEGLMGVFMTADERMPKPLREALFFINEMATHEGMACLLDEVEQRDDLRVAGQPAPSPADVAVQVWLQDREVLERKHAEQFLWDRRTFEYYQTVAEPVPEFREPAAAVIGALTEELNDWFEKKRRGRSSRVFMYIRPDGVWFLVRHGDPFKREGAIGENGESTGVYYWPEKFDVLVYNTVLGEVRMNARTKGERKLYRQALGRHLFGDAGFFPGEAKYTLEPLRELGEPALVCTDVDGMESVILTEIHFMWGGSYGEQEIRRADDVFGAYRTREASMPTKPRIIKASFRVTFSDSDTPRTVTIKPPNVAKYTRDADGVVVERWLELRGFVLPKEGNREPSPEPVLARN